MTDHRSCDAHDVSELPSADSIRAGSRADDGPKRGPVPGVRRPPLRILTHSLVLDPIGGVEVCTLQDSLALAARGNTIDIMYGADGSLRPVYQAQGIGLNGPYTFGFDPHRAIRDVAGFTSAGRWARARKPDVLLLNRFEHIVWGQVVGRTSGAPIVCYLHHLPNYRRVTLLTRGVAHFVAVSEFVRNAYVETGIEPERISLVYNAVPDQLYPFGGREERSAARAALGLPPNVPIALCYGQMSAEKGIPVLLKAWREVRARDPEAILVLVDSNSESTSADSEVEAEMRRLDPQSYRSFPITSDVVPFLHAADVVVFPSLLKEAFGRVVIEGMVTGRPVVASRIGAVPEILSGPMARFLVDPDSPEQLADKLTDVLTWRVSEPELGAECARWVDEKFPFGAHVDSLEDILQRHRRPSA